jgi:hypothetical protein
VRFLEIDPGFARSLSCRENRPAAVNEVAEGPRRRAS